jgi:hypothetical protein
VHVQVMDHASVLFAAGLPMRFDRYLVDGTPESGMPRNGVAFEAPDTDVVVQPEER